MHHQIQSINEELGVTKKKVKGNSGAAQLLSHVQLFATPQTVACQGPLSMRILQARILEWVAMPYFRGSSQPRDWTQVSHIVGGFFTVWATREAPGAKKYNEKIVLVFQSCLTLGNTMDYSRPGSSVHGILQARILEWVVIPFSRESSETRDWTWVSCIVGRFLTVWATKEVPKG